MELPRLHFHGDVPASRARNPQEWLREINSVSSSDCDMERSKHNDGVGDAVMLVLLYGSWNAVIFRDTRGEGRGMDGGSSSRNGKSGAEDKHEGDVCSGTRRLGSSRWFRQAMEPAVNPFISVHRKSMQHGLHVASVQVDASDESLNLCCEQSAEMGGLEAPSELPALVFIQATNIISENSGGSTQRTRMESSVQVRRVPIKASKLHSFLRNVHPDNNASAIDNANSGENIRWNNLENEILHSMNTAWSELLHQNPHTSSDQPNKSSNPTSDDGKKTSNVSKPPIRIFIAGDKSQVGKSSISLGILGSLLATSSKYNNHDENYRYQPGDLAYIKPATQCEQTQLIEHYCKHKGIEACVPIGPIVYYKGFTRAFLRGEVRNTEEELLEMAARAVDDVCDGKKVVVVDGVGYPAVGSITGTDNASVAVACGRPFDDASSSTSQVDIISSACEDGMGAACHGAEAPKNRAPIPVLLVGKSGVGDAVDSFNLNATYFANRNVPVIGAIFNKLSTEGFYSLENCKEAIDMYFSKRQPKRKAYGYIPEIPSLKIAREAMAKDNVSSEEEKLNTSLQMADSFVEEFSKCVNVHEILRDAEEVTTEYIRQHQAQSSQGSINGKSAALKRDHNFAGSHSMQPAKIPRLDPQVSKLNIVSARNAGFSLTRDQIEAMASAAGAAGG